VSSVELHRPRAIAESTEPPSDRAPASRLGVVVAGEGPRKSELSIGLTTRSRKIQVRKSATALISGHPERTGKAHRRRMAVAALAAGGSLPRQCNTSANTKAPIRYRIKRLSPIFPASYAGTGLSVGGPLRRSYQQETGTRISLLPVSPIRSSTDLLGPSRFHRMEGWNPRSRGARYLAPGRIRFSGGWRSEFA